MENRNELVVNELLLRRVVRSIEKAVGEDIKDYLRDNRKETNNALRQMSGDNINENLRKMVVAAGIELIPFTRSAWDGRILIDRNNRITYTIITKRTLHSIPRKKGRRVPHYLQSLLYNENKDCKATFKQMSLVDFGVIKFDAEELEEDFDHIMGGYISREENYRHYIIVYEAERCEVKNVTLQLLDKDFDVVDECSLNNYINVDFAKLTEMKPVTQENNEEEPHRVHSLLKVKKAGVKPDIKKVDEEQA